MKKYIIGITGASGSIYAVRLIEELIKRNCEVYLVATDNGKKVFEYELKYQFNDWVDNLNSKNNRIKICNIDDMFFSIASGSFKTDGMIILPCSMATIAKLAAGIADNLLIRAGDVMLKEKRKLILVPRETPLSSIHLKNMLTLSELNVTIIPPMPAFYNHPSSIEDIVNGTVGRILESLEIENNLYYKWKGNK
ncbi:UbiX family flavin prenyltransferase [Clostridium aciditolerans]|uniref:Flavin prenyltransferase UbiX n=1 Tax=Clostridium aciditolerans TaxID=339861 RepID=A0A934HV89_9CLOT|nr:flavin prenyltransferase UbiX [Clostridium aciditolerans]MBI6875211.1 UbiX family flavin prenyltransferase [Clostridium aciditolerans]